MNDVKIAIRDLKSVIKQVVTESSRFNYDAEGNHIMDDLEMKKIAQEISALSKKYNCNFASACGFLRQVKDKQIAMKNFS